MSGTIVVDRIESDASYASSINIASPLIVANTVTFNQPVTVANTVSFSQPVTVSNTFVVPAGTVSTPAITPTGDTNTGIYFPEADTIGFVEGGAERLRLNSAGSLLLGTTTNRGLLTVNGSGSFGSGLQFPSDFATLNSHVNSTHQGLQIQASVPGVTGGTGQAGGMSMGARAVMVTSSGTALTIPVTNQGNINATYLYELIFVPTGYNQRLDTRTARVLIAIGSLSVLNYTVVERVGNCSSVTNSGMNLIFNFSNGYNTGSAISGTSTQGCLMFWRAYSSIMGFVDFLEINNATFN